MNWDQFFTVSGWLVGVASLVYAWRTNKETIRLKDHARAEAWNLYRSANNACGDVQGALGLYKKAHSNQIDPSILEVLSKADARSLGVYHDAIRQIQWAESRFDTQTIDSWIKLGKVTPAHKENFVKIVVNENVHKARAEIH